MSVALMMDSSQMCGTVFFSVTLLLCNALLLLNSTNDESPVSRSSTIKNKPAYKPAEADFKNKEQILSLYKNICNNSQTNMDILHPRTQFDSIVLVVLFNNPFYDIIPVIELLYRPLFPRIVYCISNGDKQQELKNWNLTYVYYTSYQGRAGWTNYICVCRVHSLGLNADGFLFMADDLLISVPAVVNLNLSQPAVPHYLPQACGIRTGPRCTGWWHYSHGVLEMDSLLKAIKKIPKDKCAHSCIRALQNITKIADPVVHSLADYYYIPASFMTDASELLSKFHAHHVFLEIAVQYVLTCLAWPTLPITIEGDAPEKADFRIYKYMCNLISSKSMRLLHPVKHSHVLRKDQRYVEPFCRCVLPFYHQLSCKQCACSPL